jgi:FtsH-binding integral membrane protein
MFEKLKNWFNAHLLDDWKQCYKWFSVHAATIGVVVAAVNEYYGSSMPQWAYSLLFAVVLMSRIVKQGSSS